MPILISNLTGDRLAYPPKMIASSTGPRKRPGGSRPAPSHSSSSSSSSHSISGARSAVPYSEYGGVYEPSTSQDGPNVSFAYADHSEIAQPIASSFQNLSLGTPQQPGSRSTTPKPKLLLKTGGGAVGSIGAPDPDVYDPADVPSLPPLPSMRSLGVTLNLQIAQPTRSAPMAPPATDGPRPTLRPPPVGGNSRKLGLMLNIPAGAAPIGAIGADEPDALDLIGPVEDLASTTSPPKANGTQPITPLNPGGDDGDVTVRPALPQGHSQAKSIDKIKAVISPGPSSGSSTSSVTAEDDWAEAEEFLVDVSRLGEGAGGEVYKVEDTRTGAKLARKIIQARTTPPKQLVRELKYLKDTVHPNIVRFYGAYISPSSSEVKVLMEFCEGGSLESIGDKIKAGKGRVSEPVAAKIGEGIFNGLNYLHSKRIIHRDIKPSNVLVSKNGTIKLCDFGVSGELVNSFANTWTGTSMYMAPERIKGGQYTIRSDVWSSGLTLMTLAQNRFPYPEDLNGIIELINYITKEAIPQLTDEDADQDGYAEVRWSQEMKDFISICMTRDEEKRPKPSEMLMHPWLLESSQRKVNMSQWIREVWDWEKRGRPTGNNNPPAQSGARSSSAVRAQQQNPSIMRAY
ncbi:Protein kinase C signaling pathway involved MAPKK protein [Serendipita sp. 396]|nr:Protein kinase C signaling pathway involved MAPKK protein [Serendipita sp. 396]KAG8785105.1 Protein kinase C signaling pathway involved MAPKK protein [Serendipita sp. 397]KAG8800723.1 Protein kinase C signaling pathway involved MAPKK protein [Serendipita sp. 398]KAG8820944.1 Protein kinase C signaling pathway involved MAPKK protein [Serendipita sp. 401]KAG8855238.1 Protein kinase C signaling pathway involved MAPKK protein [Serendipita sp. 411]KAG8868949.1 Protein kinase C signaling pathway 